MKACRRALVSVGWLLVARGWEEFTRFHLVTQNRLWYVTQFLLHTKEMANQVGISANTTNS